MQPKRPAGPLAGDRTAAAVVHHFTADPLRISSAERIARELDIAEHDVQPILDHLTALGILTRRPSPAGQPPVFLMQVADQFLDILERLSAYYNEQMEDIAVSPERAQLVAGEPPAESDRIHALRARVASVEAANALLQRKNLELAFLNEASLLLASSIDLSTLGQTVVNAVVNGSGLKVGKCFVALADGDAFVFHAGHGIDSLEAERFLFRHRRRLRQCLERGEVIITQAETQQGSESEGAICAIIPMVSRPPLRGYGCIIITCMEEGGLTGDNVRTLTQLAELAGRSLANATLYSRSVALGMTDALTGVLNRRYLDRRLADETKRVQRSGGNLSVIILDLDLFKDVNDRFGHLEGDRMLQVIAKTISTSVRDIDVVTRFGGEEFAVILPGAAEADAYAVAERVRVAVETMDYESANGVAIPVTISAGVAQFKGNVHTPAQLIGLADRRLLEAKRSGRNRTIAGMVHAPL
jgi:diguanylate cyclase (GGDEF)-like protein